MNELPPVPGTFVVGNRRAKFSGVAPRRTSRSTSPRAIGRSIPTRGTLMRSWSSGVGARTEAAGLRRGIRGGRTMGVTAMWGAGVLSEARAEPLLEALEPAALFALVVDATGRITFSNGRARELLSRQEGDEVVDHLR